MRNEYQFRQGEDGGWEIESEHESIMMDCLDLEGPPDDSGAMNDVGDGPVANGSGPGSKRSCQKQKSTGEKAKKRRRTMLGPAVGSAGIARTSVGPSTEHGISPVDYLVWETPRFYKPILTDDLFQDKQGRASASVTGTVYGDGLCFEAGQPELATAGWSIAVLDEHLHMYTFWFGSLPGPIQDSARAEHFAMERCIDMAIPPVCYVTDCEPISGRIRMAEVHKYRSLFLVCESMEEGLRLH